MRTKFTVFIAQAYQTSQYVVPSGGIFLGKWRSSFAGSSDGKMNVQTACALNTRYLWTCLNMIHVRNKLDIILCSSPFYDAPFPEKIIISFSCNLWIILEKHVQELSSPGSDWCGFSIPNIIEINSFTKCIMIILCALCRVRLKEHRILSIGAGMGEGLARYLPPSP
jgi:hypothetical protein